MPGLGLGAQRCAPALAVAPRRGVRLGGVVAAPLRVRLVDAALHLPSLGAGGALGLAEAGGGGGDRGWGDPRPLGVRVRAAGQRLTTGAAVAVALRFGGELLPAATRGRGGAVGCGRSGGEPGSLRATMVSVAPEVVSPVTGRGRSCQRPQTRHSRSRIGRVSLTAAGLQGARMIRAFPRSTPSWSWSSRSRPPPRSRIDAASESVTQARTSATRRELPPIRVRAGCPRGRSRRGGALRLRPGRLARQR